MRRSSGKPRARSGSRGKYEIAAPEELRVAEGALTAKPTRHRTIRATDAARSFSDLINRVGYKGETFIIERGGKPMCELIPIATHRFTGSDFLALLETLPRPDAEFLDTVEKLARSQPTIGDSPWEG